MKTGNCSWRAAACGMLAAALAAGPAAAQEWKPQKNVEIVVAAGAGGSADRGSRVAQKYLQALPGMPSVTVSNRQGGGGTLAWTYIAQHPGDPHYLGTLSPGLVTSEIVGASQLSYRDFTPLNILMREYIVVSVKADSPLASAQDLAARFRKDPASVSFGFAAALGNQNHVVIGMMARAAGVDPKALMERGLREERLDRGFPWSRRDAQAPRRRIQPAAQDPRRARRPDQVVKIYIKSNT
jgi:putative tricarboxylic transport membrane protein